MRRFATVEDLVAAEGEHLGTSDWMVIDAERVREFAHCTGDQHWLHTDPERASQSRFGQLIAHGFLTMSLLADFSTRLFRLDGAELVVNYGLDRVRFPAPVPVGSRVRASAVLQHAEKVTQGARVTIRYVFECDTATRPVCIAEHVSLRLSA
ncbi:MaoC family dehydratase [Streptomyces tendae]